MRKAIKLSIIIIMMVSIISPIPIMAENVQPTRTVPLKKKPKEEPSYPIETDSEGHRSPARPIICTISKADGLFIPGTDNDDVISFELYDTNGMCIGLFSNSEDFISSFFSCIGEFEVRFITSEYIYVGYITL